MCVEDAVDEYYVVKEPRFYWSDRASQKTIIGMSESSGRGQNGLFTLPVCASHVIFGPTCLFLGSALDLSTLLSLLSV